MFETIQEWIYERPKNPPGMLSLLSLLLFSSLCLVSAAFLMSSYWWLFGLLVTVDVLGMLTSAEIVVSADRALFFVAVAITAIVMNPSNVFLTMIEILGLIAVLDFSFLLRKVDGTGVDRSVFAKRLKSYTYTVLPAFLLTYLLLILYSQNLTFSVIEAAIVLGLASAGTLIIVYTVVRYMLTLDKI